MNPHTSLLVFTSLVIKIAVGLNFRNNACRNYSDYPKWFYSDNCYYNPNFALEAPTIIRAAGFPFEGYNVLTSDGYALTLWRIPARDNRKNKQPVYFLNGLYMSSDVWVFTGNRSLVFNLANEGYDIWLGSIRGTSPSKIHQRYKLSDPEFWDFNLDKLAEIDVRMQLRFVANKTGKAGSIIFIGHSMGSTLSFFYASGNAKEAHSLLAGIISLAPVAYFTDNSLVKDFVSIGPNLKRVLNSRNITGVNYQPIMNHLTVYSCTLLPHMCLNSMSMYFGNVSSHWQPDDLLLLLAHFPEGTSVEVLLQYMQIAKSNVLKKFDYGKIRNMQIYRQFEPPLYDLSQIKMPVYLFYGKTDTLTTSKALEKLFRELGSRKKALLHIPTNAKLPPFSHLDFIIAKDLHESLFGELYKVINHELKPNN